MSQMINDAWRLTQALNFGGVAAAVMGVGVFGWTFVKLNALAARGETETVPSSSWQGKSARLAFIIFASGVAMQVLGYALGAMLPLRT
jgi:hypothetical protein